MNGKLTAAVLLGVSLLPVPALAGGWGGGGGSASGSDGDWALRDELKNPRLIQPGSPYGYDRSYARGPAPWPAPPAYQAPGMRQPTRCLRSACPRNGDAEPHCRLSPTRFLKQERTVLQFEILPDRKVVIVRPKEPLETADFERLGADVDALIRERGKLKGVLVDAPAFLVGQVSRRSAPTSLS